MNTHNPKSLSLLLIDLSHSIMKVAGMANSALGTRAALLPRHLACKSSMAAGGVRATSRKQDTHDQSSQQVGHRFGSSGHHSCILALQLHTGQESISRQEAIGPCDAAIARYLLWQHRGTVRCIAIRAQAHALAH